MGAGTIVEIRDNNPATRYLVVDDGREGGLSIVYRAIELTTDGKPTSNVKAIKIMKAGKGKRDGVVLLDEHVGPRVIDKAFRDTPNDPRQKYLLRETPVDHLKVGSNDEQVRAVISDYLEGIPMDRAVALDTKLMTLGKSSNRLAVANATQAKKALITTFLLNHDLEQGLSFYAERGILHNDIKMANIMLVPGYPPKFVLIDGGLAQTIRGMQKPNGREGYLTGTTGYVAPERVAAARKNLPPETLTSNSDRYAKAATLWNALFDDSIEFSRLNSAEKAARLSEARSKLESIYLDEEGMRMFDILKDSILSDSSRNPAERGKVGLKDIAQRFDIEKVRVRSTSDLNVLAESRQFSDDGVVHSTNFFGLDEFDGPLRKPNPHAPSELTPSQLLDSDSKNGAPSELRGSQLLDADSKNGASSKLTPSQLLESDLLVPNSSQHTPSKISPSQLLDSEAAAAPNQTSSGAQKTNPCGSGGSNLGVIAKELMK